ncbi:apolipoprotein N-acyltransferase [Telmatospirillum siberiense]|uniref:Apolipoprotein N-acyltransferase n=1 Tax=Telmatospirillum siberiense TaxID=382514 RepID=A0A2N3PSH4_9PROT|nr:apolipoprotein N-acyltransferase [Telmatospirillum siberiense]PKU23326.1 apolipoprotein N-acyltransferase [Telmatospirillum siberiense]
MNALFSRLAGAALRLAHQHGWRRRGLAVLLGVLAALALPPIHALPLLWIAFPGLILLLDGGSGGRQAFTDGCWFGFGHFSLGLYWISYALLVDPVRFGWLVPVAVFGLGGLLGLFVGAATFFARRLAPPGVPRVLALALAWVLFEWVRSWIFTGFSWNLIGSVWMPVLPVVQFAAVAGTYGLGLLTVAAAAMPALLVRPSRSHRSAVVASLLVLAMVAVWGSVRLADGGVPTVTGVRLRLVQPNIEQTLKWKPEMRMAHLQEHLDLTLSPGWDKVTDVIWSETAAPSFLERDGVARSLIAAVTPPGGLLITGAVRGTPPGVEPFRVWNSMLALTRQGDIAATYDKAHLVPFGEYVPLHSLLPLDKITAGSVDFTPGPGVSTLLLPGLPPAGPLICYEVIFPGEVVDRTHRPGWLLNLTNDGWYGISAGPYQHFAAARLRAVEEGLPLVRAANTGISGVIDPYGRVLARLPLGTRGILDADLPTPLPAEMPFARFGLFAPLVLWVLTMFCLVFWLRVFRAG